MRGFWRKQNNFFYLCPGYCPRAAQDKEHWRREACCLHKETRVPKNWISELLASHALEWKCPPQNNKGQKKIRSTISPLSDSDRCDISFWFLGGPFLLSAIAARACPHNLHDPAWKGKTPLGDEAQTGHTIFSTPILHIISQKNWNLFFVSPCCMHVCKFYKDATVPVQCPYSARTVPVQCP